MNIKYVHANLIARDWKKLSQFYIDVFGCEPQYPERDLAGEWIDQMTGLRDVRVRGMHLRLPGYVDGPTLEIFQYEPEDLRNTAPGINSQGFGHIAFHVDDVETVAKNVIAHGGKDLGGIIRKEYEGLGRLTAAYMRDPEGNCIEIQNWS